MAATAPSPDKKYVPAIDRSSGWDDYDLKSFLRTLQEAEKIRRNKPLMAALKKEAKAQLDVATKTHSQFQGGSK